jgi:hypothetical protein
MYCPVTSPIGPCGVISCSAVGRRSTLPLSWAHGKLHAALLIAGGHDGWEVVAARGVVRTSDALAFEQLEGALGHGVVPADSVRNPRGWVVRGVFEDANNFMKSGQLLRLVINKQAPSTSTARPSVRGTTPHPPQPQAGHT